MQVLVKDLLRKYPQWSQDCIAVVGNISSRSVQEPKAKAALIWMLGEYAQDMKDSPYMLKSFIENWDDEHCTEVISLSCFTVFFDLGFMISSFMWLLISVAIWGLDLYHIFFFNSEKQINSG